MSSFSLRAVRSVEIHNVIKQLVVIILCVLMPAAAWPALPLITDDTGTQGKGKFLLEFGGEYDRDRETDAGVLVRETDHALTTVLTYGIAERVDVFVGVPYIRAVIRTDGGPGADVRGVSDTTFGAKWRFYERSGSSLAVEPLASLPTGNEEEGLGSGKIDYGTHVIGTHESGPWEFDADFAYIRNENKIGERVNVWHASMAAVYEAAKGLKICADIGADTNRDKTSEIEPAYLLGGIIYSATKDIDFSFGLKAGLNTPATDFAVLPGVTYRF